MLFERHEKEIDKLQHSDLMWAETLALLFEGELENNQNLINQ